MRVISKARMEKLKELRLKERKEINRLACRVAELEEELMAHQVSDGYQQGYDHGVASAIQTLTDSGRCDRYLAARHCTLWGEPFEIISPKGREQAAAWLAAQIAGAVGFTSIG